LSRYHRDAAPKPWPDEFNDLPVRRAESVLIVTKQQANSPAEGND